MEYLRYPRTLHEPAYIHTTDTLNDKTNQTQQQCQTLFQSCIHKYILLQNSNFIAIAWYAFALCLRRWGPLHRLQSVRKGWKDCFHRTRRRECRQRVRRCQQISSPGKKKNVDNSKEGTRGNSNRLYKVRTPLSCLTQPH